MIGGEKMLESEKELKDELGGQLWLRRRDLLESEKELKDKPTRSRNRNSLYLLESEKELKVCCVCQRARL
jgi:hypothetical protein